MGGIQERFSCLRGESLKQSMIGSTRKTVYYNSKFFVIEKNHDDFELSHTYGVEVRRQPTLLSNSALSVLRDNPHPAIPFVYDCDDKFAVFEFVDGQVAFADSVDLPTDVPYVPNLRQLNAPSICDIADIGTRYAWLDSIKRAIDHLHSLGIAHTDIVPINILVNPTTKVVKIVDLFSCVTVNSQSHLYSLDWNCFYKYVIPYFITGHYNE